MQYKDYIQNRSGCPFCATADRKLVRDAHAYLTYAVAPYHKHHLLVIPERHVESITELTPEEELSVSELQKTALGILTKLGYQSSTLLVREGKNSGKSVAHIHFHIVPDVVIGTLDGAHGGDRRVLSAEEIAETVLDIQKVL